MSRFGLPERFALPLGEVEGTGGEVLRYGIELMDWNAAWWADRERRLS